MKKLVCIFCVLSMFMISCSGGDSESSASNNGSLVKRAVTDATVFEYSYNGNKIATISALNQLQTFTYSGNLITKTSRFLNGHSVADFEVKYEYDANQQLIKETFFDYQSSTADKKVFTYNSDNTVFYQTYSGDLTNQTTLGRNGVFYLNANGEVFKKEEFYQGNLSLRSEYTFDAKNNIFKNVTGFAKLITYQNGRFNNVLTSNNYDSGGTLVYGVSAQYTYNFGNFPISVITTSNGSSSTTQYFYN